ncbi:glycosyltransferase [Oceaniglobus indicus]|uniref:glycosyltransferase n=1 Tax=Oceaniglobus indicus TaxID=2047749 RepID=UPI000C182D68|nr:glycosyltransferase family 2 protein [Oceaniglobus indicus]
MSVSVILPAHDEAGYIGPCLAALLDSDLAQAEVIVIANGCQDDTVAVAQGYADRFASKGWPFRVIDTPEGGKLNALNIGDAAASHGTRVYLDADVIVSPPLLAALAAVLDTDAPRYAGGTPRIAPAQSALTRAYARFWVTLPFVTDGVPGFGIFAVNAAGRARWGRFPDIISDDTFVRLHFAGPERHRVAAVYHWPMVEGFANLVRVRRRQDRGVAEIAARFPGLLANDDKQRVGFGGVLRRALRDPVGFAAYATVAVAVRLPVFRHAGAWARGR